MAQRLELRSGEFLRQHQLRAVSIQRRAADAIADRQRLHLRTNVLESFFILTRQNLTWTGVGYVVDTISTNYFNPLYRFSMSTNVQAADPTMLFNIFLTNLPAYTGLPISPTNPSMSHLMDGVVDLRVRAYDPGGLWMTNGIGYYDPADNHQLKNVLFSPPQWAEGEVGFYMFSNTLPASVEINLGVLEDRAIQRAQSLPDMRRAWAQSNYLAAPRRPGPCLPPARLDPQR